MEKIEILKQCIYCKCAKPEEEFTLEHIIPQFLGGAQAPDELKTRSVCKACNNNLGLFVDAAFEKDFMVFNALNEAAYSFFNPEKPSSFPLRSLGVSDLDPPQIQDNEVCESWLGPLGEQIYWIRPADEKMYWYSGGNPRTVKEVKTRAYFLWAERSQKNPIITYLSFKDAFVGRKVRKISCTQVDGIDIKDIGFSEPDRLDIERIGYFLKECGNGQERKNRISMYLHYDIRFMAKLAIGLNYVLFGKKIIDSNYSKELYKALWFREGDAKPAIKGQSNLSQQDSFLKEKCGIANGATITIHPVHNDIIVNLNLNRKMNWFIKSTQLDIVKDFITDDLKNGLCIVLFKTLNKGIKISFPDLIAHNHGNILHPELAAIQKQSDLHNDYFKNL